MNIHRFCRVCILALTAGLWLATPHVGASESLFNYQGRLDAGDQNGHGLYEFRFRLVDAEGQTVGAIVNPQDVPVEGGVFSVDLDFGPGVFDGRVRELEVAVRPSGSTEDYTMLAPRQRILRVPQASHADYASALIGSLPPEQLPPAVARLDRDQTFTTPPLFHPSSGPPFRIGSSETVTNLSADRLDGLDATAFWRRPTGSVSGIVEPEDKPFEIHLGETPVLRLEPGLAAPNLVLGAEVNGLAPGLSGAVILGGHGNQVTASHSLAGGVGARAEHAGAFLWADGIAVVDPETPPFRSHTSNEFAVRATGGVRFETGGKGLSIDGTNLTTWIIQSSPMWGSLITVTQLVDGTVLTELLDDDGPGSGLDADQLDGFSSEDFWRVAGNGGTTAGTHFLGTTDDEPLVLKVNQRQGLRLQPDVPVTCMENTADAMSPSLAGGYEGNLIVAGKAGSVIGGGGAAEHPCLGANLPNVIAANFASIGGGLGNRLDGDTSAIGGGYANVIEHSANYCVIAGGGANRISSAGVVASAADGSTISGGSLNEIRDDSNASTIGGGGHNLITSNVDDATIGGGVSNVVSAFGATIPGGYAAGARHYGQWAYAAGPFVQPGDAQTSLYILRGASTNTLFGELFLDGRSARLRVPKGGAWTFEALVIGRNPAGPSGGYRITGVIENDPAGGTAFIGAPTTTAIGEDVAAWTVEALASDVDDTLRLRVQGTAGLTRWVANVRTVEILF